MTEFQIALFHQIERSVSALAHEISTTELKREFVKSRDSSDVGCVYERPGAMSDQEPRDTPKTAHDQLVDEWRANAPHAGCDAERATWLSCANQLALTGASAPTCAWTFADPDSDYWETTCGHTFR